MLCSYGIVDILMVPLKPPSPSREVSNSRSVVRELKAPAPVDSRWTGSNLRLSPARRQSILSKTLPLPFLPSWKWKIGPSNISFLSFRVSFHFHDYGRKGRSISCPQNLTKAAPSNAMRNSCFRAACTLQHLEICLTQWKHQALTTAKWFWKLWKCAFCGVPREPTKFGRTYPLPAMKNQSPMKWEGHLSRNGKSHTCKDTSSKEIRGGMIVATCKKAFFWLFGGRHDAPGSLAARSSYLNPKRQIMDCKQLQVGVDPPAAWKRTNPWLFLLFWLTVTLHPWTLSILFKPGKCASCRSPTGVASGACSWYTKWDPTAGHCCKQGFVIVHLQLRLTVTCFLQAGGIVMNSKAKSFSFLQFKQGKKDASGGRRNLQITRK